MVAHTSFNAISFHLHKSVVCETVHFRFTSEDAHAEGDLDGEDWMEPSAERDRTTRGT